MNANKTILTAVAAAVIGLGSTAAMAQQELPGYFDDQKQNRIPPSPDHPQRGGTLKPADPRPNPGQDRNSTDNSQLNQGSTTTTERRVVTTPPVVQQAPMTTNNTTVQGNSYMQDGVDTRFIKPADPAKVNPDVNANGGANRVLAEDRAINGQGYTGRVVGGEVVRDVSNHPIDSLNDPRFRNPVIPADQFNAMPASGRESPTVIVPPATQPSGVIAPRSNSNMNTSGSMGTNKDGEYKSTWSSPSDRKALDPAVRDHANSPDVDKSSPAPSKGERAPNALDNTRNPVPGTTTPNSTNR